MKIKNLLSLILTLGVAVQSAAVNVYASEVTVQKIYVRANYAGSNEAGTLRAPYNTIEEAKTAAIEKLAAGDVEILVADGTYFLDEAVDFNSSQMANTDNSLTIKPYQTGNVIISGGEKLDNSKFIEHDAPNNIYKIPYTGTIQRQLYVNGTPATRSRSTENDLTFDLPQGATDVNGDGEIADNEVGTIAITTTNTAVANWNIANIAEIVFKNSFVSPRRFVTGVTVKDGVAKFEIKHGTYILEQAYPLTGDSGGIFWLENALEVLDEPGEWCHDGQYIYYKLRDGEDISTAEIILPKLDSSAVSFTGTAAKPIKNITVEGITFSHNTWMHVSEEGWLNPAQSNVVGGVPEPFGLVNTTYAENVVFNNCTFTNGGGSGITIMDGSKNVTVKNCEISNISSAGILVGSIQNARYGKNEADLVRNITIEQNSIHDCAIGYYAATAIAVAYEKDIKIVHNEIYNMPYS
ncbi:MAG: right-handed parallel beta-helix repeat-containing protein, partial [Eubacteriales bacterium]|nr:right-handed parallel beta-helix repeat-containing protein [Eubacteriales bacterium]